MFGVILFFPVVILILSLIQSRLEKGSHARMAAAKRGAAKRGPTRRLVALSARTPRG